MKSSLIILGSLLACAAMSQSVEAVVDTSGITLVDETDTERISLDAETQCIEIAVNDTLILKINGQTTPASVTLINTNTLLQVGMEIGGDGSFSFGEFGLPPTQARSSVMSIQNGIYRPASNTAAIATNSTERLRIIPDGKIGIGTITPTEQLDINGGLRIRMVTEDPTEENILVINPAGEVRFRPFFSFPGQSPTQSNLAATVEAQRKQIEVLHKRLLSLELKMSSLESGDRE